MPRRLVLRAVLRGTGAALLVGMLFVAVSLLLGRSWASMLPSALVMVLVDLLVFTIAFVRTAYRRHDQQAELR